MAVVSGVALVVLPPVAEPIALATSVSDPQDSLSSEIGPGWSRV